jgi:hypothetical protein
MLTDTTPSGRPAGADGARKRSRWVRRKKDAPEAVVAPKGPSGQRAAKSGRSEPPRAI